MRIKKTFYNWLTNRFLLIIRNEENFAEKRTFSFNYAKLIVFGITFLVLVFALSFYLLNTVLYALNPSYKEAETNKRLILLTNEVDSLVAENRRLNIYDNNLKRILSGQASSIYADTLTHRSKRPVIKEIKLDSLTPADIALRHEMEEDQKGKLGVRSGNQQSGNYFVKPVEGIVLQSFDAKAGKFGVEIATKSGEIVKAIAEGVVIFTSFSPEGSEIGVQHKNGFISIYKHNIRLLKDEGEFVNSGEPIGISDESKDKNQVYFELLQEGNAVNPAHFISF